MSFVGDADSVLWGVTAGVLSLLNNSNLANQTLMKSLIGIECRLQNARSQARDQLMPV